MPLQLDYWALLGTGIIVIATITIKYGPVLFKLLGDSATFTKKIHDEYCGLRLDSLRQRLTAIEAHEAEAKISVKEIWQRLEQVIDQMHKYHDEVMQKLKK